MLSIAMLFKRFSQFLIFILFLLVLTGKSTYGENRLHVESFPRVVKQGEVCVIRASGPTSIKSVFGKFRGETFPMFIAGQNGTFMGLLGIDMETRPARYEIKMSATDEGGRTYSGSLLLDVEKVDFGKQVLSLPPSMVDLDAKTLERVNQEARRLNALFQGFRDERLWSGAFIYPVQGEITSAFGVRRVINGQPRSPHTGVDLRAEEGTPVLACNSGMVVLNDHLFLSGKSIILDHGLGLYSMYFHLSEALVCQGDRVSKGATFGRVGSTGRSTKSHLHWGIRMNGARIDPLSLFRLTEHLRE